MRRKLYLFGVFLALCVLAALGPILRLGQSQASA
jgi:hypothetical protein